MSDFMSLPTWLSNHFQDNWSAILQGNGKRINFGGLAAKEYIIPDAKTIKDAKLAAIIVGIQTGKNYRTAAAVWAEGEWHGLSAEDAEDQMVMAFDPALRQRWLDWADLLPDSPTTLY